MAQEKPHIDAASGQAAWILAQTLSLLLVKFDAIPKRELQSELEKAIQHHRNAPGMNPAQRGAAFLLESHRDLLHTADRRDAN